VAAGHPEPIYTQVAGGTLLTLPSYKPIGSTTSHLIKPKLTDRQEAIIKVLQKHGSLSISELREKLTMDVPERTLRDELNRLKGMDLVNATGQTTMRKWRVC